MANPGAQCSHEPPSMVVDGRRGAAGLARRPARTGAGLQRDPEDRRPLPRLRGHPGAECHAPAQQRADDERVQQRVGQTPGHDASHRHRAVPLAPRPVPVRLDIRRHRRQRPRLFAQGHHMAGRHVPRRRRRGEDLERSRPGGEEERRDLHPARRRGVRPDLRAPGEEPQAAARASRRADRRVAAARSRQRALPLLLHQPAVAPLWQAAVPDARGDHRGARSDSREASDADRSSARTWAAWNTIWTESPSASIAIPISISSARRGREISRVTRATRCVRCS